MFETDYRDLSKLEKEIFHDVMEAEEGIDDVAMAKMAQRYKITTEKILEILLKLEKDGYLESEDE